MNNNTICIIFFILLLSCDPHRSTLIPDDIVKVKGTLNKVNEVLAIGDTLIFYVKLPLSTETVNGPVIIQSINPTARKSFFSATIYEVDTVAKTSKFIFYKENTAPVYGLIDKGFVNDIYICEFNPISPFEFQVNLIMRRRGVYYIQIRPQAGTLYYNNNRTARVYVNFEVSNKHFDLLGLYFGPAFVQSITGFDQMGFGTYAFRVE